MTDDDVTAMFRPKLDARRLLHELSLPHPVRQFVLFSSISGLLGSRWLAHYAATTTFLDTFAYARRAAGLPATRDQLGPVEVVGRQPSRRGRQVTLDSGLEPMPDEVAIQALVRSPVHMPPSAQPSSPPTGADWPPRTAPGRHCTSWTTCCRLTRTAKAHRCSEPSSGRHCATATRTGVVICWSIT